MFKKQGAVLFLIFVLLFSCGGSGCQSKRESKPRVGGGVSPRPESLKEALKEKIKGYLKFRTLEEAEKAFGKELRLPKIRGQRILGFFVSPDREEVLILFDDYPPGGIYLSIIKKRHQPDYKRRVEEVKKGFQKGKIKTFSLPQFISVAGHSGLAEEPSYQGGERKIPVSGFVVWWNNGLEYYLFGKADSKEPSTNVKELLEIANSMYFP